MPEIQAIPRDPAAERKVAMSDFADAGNGRIVKSESQEMQQLQEEVAAVQANMAEIGTIPASIVNLHDAELGAQGVHTANVRVPPCPIGQAYYHHVMPHAYEIEIVDKGGAFGARPITAIALARDFVEQQKRYERGGVFCYLGDHRPGENPDKKKAAEEIGMLEKTRKEMLRYYERLVNEANSEWVKPNKSGVGNIDDRHRKAARYLLHYKLLKKEPEWLTVLRSEEEVANVCPKCQTEVNRGAKECKVCTYVLDPEWMLVNGEITAEHHSLRRLPQSVLNRLGLKDVKSLYKAKEQPTE